MNTLKRIGSFIQSHPLKSIATALYLTISFFSFPYAFILIVPIMAMWKLI